MDVVGVLTCRYGLGQGCKLVTDHTGNPVDFQQHLASFLLLRGYVPSTPPPTNHFHVRILYDVYGICCASGLSFADQCPTISPK